MRSVTRFLLNESRDVFREVLVKVDWSVLVLLSSSKEYETAIQALVKDNTFWHNRLTHFLGEGIMSVLGWSLVDRAVNYARVCVLHERTLTEPRLDRRYFHCASYLPALLLTEVLYDVPKYTNSIREGSPSEFWGAIVELPVLEHALTNRCYTSYWSALGTIEVGLTYLLSSCMRTCTQEKNYSVATAATQALSSRFKTHGITPDFVPFLASILQSAATAGASTDISELIVALRELSSMVGDPVDFYVAIAKTGNVSAWNAWRDAFRGGNRPSKTVVKLARECHTGVKFVLDQEGPMIMKPGEWNRVLLSAMKTGVCSEVGLLVLPFCNVTTPKNTMLHEAAGMGVNELSLVLSDPRTRPEKNLEAILTTITLNKDRRKRPATTEMVEEQILTLTRHARFDLSALSAAEVQLLSTGLKGRIDKRIEAWDEFNSMYGTRTDLMLLQNGTDSSLLDLTLRAILFLDLDARSLLEWMLKSGIQKYYLASRSLLNGVPSKSTDVRVIASLLQIVSSTKPLLEDMTDLLGAGTSESMVLLSAQLASLTLGVVELRKRM